MTNSIHILDDLAGATRDGREFYEHAATKVASRELRELFTRLAGLKGDILQGLAGEIRAEGDTPPQAGTWSADFRRFYADLRSKLGDRDRAYVAQLEESEDQLLKAFTRALDDPDISIGARAVIAAYLPEVRTCHEAMRERKLSLNKKKAA